MKMLIDQITKDLLEAKTFSDFLKTLENLEVIAWQIFREF
jgi:hypothetical protein